MSDIFNALLENLVSEANLNISNGLSSLVDQVFYIEKHISLASDLFSSVTELIYYLAIWLLILKFTIKGFQTYIVGIEGDPDSDPFLFLARFAKAVILMLTFPLIYEIFARISIGFMNEVLSVISSTNDILSADNIGEYLIEAQIASLSLVAAFVFIVILYFQILMRGVEMWIMRCGFYLACVGLVESDNGAFAPYLMTFFKCALTTFVQVTLLLLGTNLLIAGDTFIGFAFMGMAIGTPKFLQQFMVPAGGGSVMGKVYQGVHLADMASRLAKG